MFQVPKTNGSACCTYRVQAASKQNQQFDVLSRCHHHPWYSPLFISLTSDLFRTSHDDPNISTTSSYLDLSPLYGSNQAEQDTVRTYTDGTLKPDCYTEYRLGAFPPGVGVLLLCFNRFHNYAVGQLASINENGKFSMPDKTAIERTLRVTQPKLTDDQVQAAVEAGYTAAVKKRDNDLFQVGRLYVPS